MRHSFVPVLASALLSLVSCQKEATAPSTTLEGTWRLTSRQCYCQPAPVPDETVTFTPNRFTFFNGNRATRLGRYSFTTGSPLCLTNGNVIPVVRFATELQFPDTTANPYSTDVQYTIKGNTLTLDYGSPCDFPLDTYERL